MQETDLLSIAKSNPSRESLHEAKRVCYGKACLLVALE